MNSEVCRVCLCEGQLISLYHRIRGISLSDMIMSFTSVHIRSDDQLPSQICSTCVDRVNNSYDFKLLCEDSDSILRKRINNSKSVLDPGGSITIKAEQNSDEDLHFLTAKCELKYDDSDNERGKSIFKIKNDIEQLENDKSDRTVLKGETSSEENFNSRVTNRFRSKSEYEGTHSKYSPSDDSDSDHLPLSKKIASIRKRSNDNFESKKHKRNKKLKKGKKEIPKAEKGSWKLKHECTTCGKVLSNKYSLKLHMRIHTGEKPFSCSYCDKSFSLRQTLRAHERVHTGEKPLLCVDCGRSFSTISNLSQHRRIHTGEKPYKCTLCPSTYRLRGHLRYHMKLHLGEKDFKCPVCDKAFVTKDDVKSHLISHSGERNFVCSMCGKKMTRSHHLKLHMMTHTGDRPYKCDICNLSFIQKGYWMKHMNKHKTNEVMKRDSKNEQFDGLDNNYASDKF